MLNSNIEGNNHTISTQKELEQLKLENDILKRQLAELKRMIFGRKSEKMPLIDTNQLSLFGDDPINEPESKTIKVTYNKEIKQKNKKRPVRKVLPAHLLRKEEIIEPEGITEDQKKIGEEVTEILEMVSAKMYVRRIIRPKYIDLKSEKIIIAELPGLPIPKGNAGATVLAYVAVSKFIDHLPLYRQLQIFKRYGIQICKSTIGGWFTKTSALLVPLYETLEKFILTSPDYLQADESPIKVQDKDKKKSFTSRIYVGYSRSY